MNNYILPLNNEITFRPEIHSFTNKEGTDYQSWSKVARALQVPFDAQGISGRMASGIARDRGISVDQAQKEILAEWEGKRISSELHGNSNHDIMERFARFGEKSSKISGAIDKVSAILKESAQYYPEYIVYSHIYHKAGIVDLVVQRQKSWRSSVFDIYDYKTNEQKGIQFDSVSRKDVIKHYNRFMLPPFDYIEDCNFAVYSFQLCSYAYMLWEMYRVKIGKLAIIFIDKLGNAQIYPVLYNPLIIQSIFGNYNELKNLPISSDRLL